ncbi:M48 family metalloprotease [Synechocystis sp. LKSZ1]|uniref:M56 family metallopeptidase n=1 Tax=Synechocystis sp. LKSZ1 TaxID=3144951 RepID=UPI00336C16B7
MHGLMVLLAMAIALMLRGSLVWRRTPLTWTTALWCFVCPPLLLLMTALAIVWMGYQGEMLGWAASLGSYLLAWAFLGWAVWGLGQRWQEIGSLDQQIQALQPTELQGQTIHLLETAFPYSAQVGFWRSRLIVSQGLIDRLNPEQLQAVLAHEAAHHHYRDGLCFFCLGWLRQMTAWLPHSERLWQELLLLREMRADQKATEKADALALAEALLLVTQASQQQPFHPVLETGAVPFYQHQQRFQVRIENLLQPVSTTPAFPNSYQPWLLLGIILILAPLAFIPFHFS